MTSDNAERAAEATRRVIARITKPKRRRRGEPFRVLGEAGPRHSMWFDDEFANTNPVVFDKQSGEWRKGKWVEGVK